MNNTPPSFAKQSLGAYALWAVVALAVVIGFITYTTDKKISLPNNTESFSITLSVEGVTENMSLRVPNGTTVLGALERASAEASFTVETKSYEGLGVLVERIQDFKNGDENRYWQYYINGDMPLVGADALVLEGGEHVEWMFAESEY